MICFVDYKGYHQRPVEIFELNLVAFKREYKHFDKASRGDRYNYSRIKQMHNGLRGLEELVSKAKAQGIPGTTGAATHYRMLEKKAVAIRGGGAYLMREPDVAPRAILDVNGAPVAKETAGC